MSIGFGIITFTAVLVATTVTVQAQNLPAPTQAATVAQLALGQFGGSGK